MVLFLTSLLRTHYYSEDGKRIPVALVDENGVLSNIRRYLKRTERFVFVANDPDDVEDNDDHLDVGRKSFGLAGLDFKEYIALDSRNKQNAREIVSGADIIILGGGKCVCQAEFFKAIELKSILKSYDGIVIGVSAGAMNLCGTVANFPEEPKDVSEPRRLLGLGFSDDIIIPHFDGENNAYQFPCEEFDIAKDYILPMSFEHDFIGLPNGSYIIVDEKGRKEYFGDVYSISKGESNKLK